jgi:putative flippase GtrA
MGSYRRADNRLVNADGGRYAEPVALTWHHLDRPLRFCVAGGVVFACDFALIWIFHKVMPSLLAVSLAYFLAVALHFCLNKWWVFAARDPLSPAQIGRYVATVLATWLGTVVVFKGALATVTGNIFVAKALAIPPATVLGFLLMRWFVFRPPTGARLPSPPPTASATASGRCRGSD